MKKYSLKYKFNDQLREVFEKPGDVHAFIEREMLSLDTETDLVRIVESLGKIGNYSRILGDLQTAEDALSEAMELIVDNGLDLLLWAKHGALVAHVYQYLNQYDIAQDMLFSIHEACQNDKTLSIILPLVHQHIGILFFNLNDFKGALKEFEIARELEEKMGAQRIEGLTQHAIDLIKNIVVEDNVIPFPSISLKKHSDDKYEGPQGLNGFLLDKISESEGLSIGDLEEKLVKAATEHYNAPNERFLGLSPNQIREAIYNAYESNNDIFQMDYNKPCFSEVPILKQARFFLKKLEDIREMKATQKGNLPRSFVLEVYNEFFKDNRFSFKPHREDDLRQLVRLKHLLLMSGLIKKRNNKFSLTKKGAVLIKSNDDSKLFKILLEKTFTKWNWAYDDFYPDLKLIQDSVIYNLYLLHKKAADWVSGDDLASSYLETFPSLIEDVEESYFGPETEILRCFELRFLERICLPLGILESREEGDELNGNVYYKTTKMFSETWNFLV